jgi:hypothetical protein
MLPASVGAIVKLAWYGGAATVASFVSTSRLPCGFAR